MAMACVIWTRGNVHAIKLIKALIAYFQLSKQPISVLQIVLVMGNVTNHVAFAFATKATVVEIVQVSKIS